MIYSVSNVTSWPHRLQLFRPSERSTTNSRQSPSIFVAGQCRFTSNWSSDSSLQASRYHSDGTSFLPLLNGNALDFVDRDAIVISLNSTWCLHLQNLVYTAVSE